MTTMTSLSDIISSSLDEVALAAAQYLPGMLTAGEVLRGTAIGSQIVPGVHSQAVSGGFSGSFSGKMSLLMTEGIAAGITEDPLGPRELTSELEPALIDAVSTMGTLANVPLRYEPARNLDIKAAIEGAGIPFAVPLFDAGAHVATLVIVLEVDPAHGNDVISNTEPPVATLPAPEPTSNTEAAAVEFEPLNPSSPSNVSNYSLELLQDVEMGVSVELGRTRMNVRDLLALTPGAVVELDRAAGSPVDLLVNGTLIARGEVVVIDEEFGVRISEIIGYQGNDSRGGK